MAQAGDSYIVELKHAHLGWGDYRHTDTRPTIYGEGYIKIPSSVARDLEIYNSNNYDGEDVVGGNLFNCSSSDGFFNGQLKAQGCSSAGDIFAKQFSESDNLKGIGGWYEYCQAEVGDSVKVEWVTDTDVIITYLG